MFYGVQNLSRSDMSMSTHFIISCSTSNFAPLLSVTTRISKSRVLGMHVHSHLGCTTVVRFLNLKQTVAYLWHDNDSIQLMTRLLDLCPTRNVCINAGPSPCPCPWVSSPWQQHCKRLYRLCSFEGMKSTELWPLTVCSVVILAHAQETCTRKKNLHKKVCQTCKFFCTSRLVQLSWAFVS